MLSTLTRNQFYQYLGYDWRERILVTYERGWIATEIHTPTFITQSNEHISIDSPWHASYHGLSGWDQYIARYDRELSLKTALDEIVAETNPDRTHRRANKIVNWENGEWHKHNKPHSTSIPLTEKDYIRVYQHTNNIVSWESGGKRKSQRHSGFIVTRRHFELRLRIIEPNQPTFADAKHRQLFLELGL